MFYYLLIYYFSNTKCKKNRATDKYIIIYTGPLLYLFILV